MVHGKRPPKGEDIKHLLIVGASSEIGLAFAKRVQNRSNLDLILTSNKTSIENTLQKESRILCVERLDATDQAAVDTLRQLVEENFTSPFAILHLPGDFWDHRSVDKCTLKLSREMMESHYQSLFCILNGLLPHMARVGGGRVLGISCTSVRFNHPEMAPFSSAKAAVETTIKCIANEWASSGITANAIALSTIATDRVRKSKPLSQVENYLELDEICELIEDVIFLGSPYLSGNILRPTKYSNTYYHKSYFERNPSYNPSEQIVRDA